MEIIVVGAAFAVLLIGGIIGYLAGGRDEKSRQTKLPPEVITYHYPEVDDCDSPMSQFEMRVIRGGKSA